MREQDIMLYTEYRGFIQNTEALHRIQLVYKEYSMFIQNFSVCTDICSSESNMDLNQTKHKSEYDFWYLIYLATYMSFNVAKSILVLMWWFRRIE